MNAKEAHKCSIYRKVPKEYQLRLTEQYDRILADYISEIEFYILLYASWGIFWCPIPVHIEPKIFLDARDHFESLGFQYKSMDYGNRSDEWHVLWCDALKKA